MFKISAAINSRRREGFHLGELKCFDDDMDNGHRSFVHYIDKPMLQVSGTEVETSGLKQLFELLTPGSAVLHFMS
jgi:hypothetical protein